MGVEDRIKILSQIYKVKEIDFEGTDNIHFGLIKYETNEILLNKNISKERKQVTLIHEILHAVFQQLGFEKENDNEYLINSLSESVILLVKENHNLLTFFT